MITLNTIYNENCIITLSRMPDKFIDMTLTSPPYDGRRTYEGEHKFDFEEFKVIAKELYRVTKEGGIVVWVVADETRNYCESLTSFKQAIYFVEECKFNLLDTMIYYKCPSCFRGMPKVMCDRKYTNSYEYMFVFSKGIPKTFNPILIKTMPVIKTERSTSLRKESGILRPIKYEHKEFKSLDNIWKILPNDNTDNKENESIHPAVFPKQLVIDHIKSWSNEGDIIYDPFSGSGTVAKCCKLMNRKYIGSEIVRKYWLMGNITLKRTDDRKKGSALWKI